MAVVITPVTADRISDLGVDFCTESDVAGMTAN